MIIAKLLTENNLRKTAYIFIVLSLIIGLITRIISVFQYTTFDIGPAPDQVRDAFLYMKMWAGNLPILGASASIGGYNLPPLYYYLVFPFTIFGANPVWQALPNAIFSFLSIPLLSYLVYTLLEKVTPSLRLFLAGLAGFWYSLIFAEVFISTFQWNPSPIPFFLIIFVLLYQYQWQRKSSLKIQAGSWILSGVVLAILVSLHSTTLFIIPLVFIISSGWFIYHNYKYKFQSRLFLPGLAVIAAIVTLFPYWQGELSRNFANTKKILTTIFTSSDAAGKANILERIIRVFNNYFNLGNQAYFVGESWLYYGLAVIFLVIVSYFGFAKFKGNNQIMLMFSCIWLLYLYAVSNFEGIDFIHYKLLIILAPIILTISTLAYLDYSQQKSLIIASFIGFCIIISCITNIYWNWQYLSSKYSENRLLSTADIINIFERIPEESIICESKYRKSRQEINPYNYIDTYITKKNFQIVSDCQPGNYYLLPKHEMKQKLTYMWPLFTIQKTKSLEVESKIVIDNNVLHVYLIK